MKKIMRVNIGSEVIGLDHDSDEAFEGLPHLYGIFGSPYRERISLSLMVKGHYDGEQIRYAKQG